MNMGLLFWRRRSLSFGTEKYRIIALRKEEYPSTRIGKGKHAHGVDKLNESLNLAFSWNFIFVNTCVFVRVTLRLEP
jgi:hypothetical protein